MGQAADADGNKEALLLIGHPGFAAWNPPWSSRSPHLVMDLCCLSRLKYQTGISASGERAFPMTENEPQSMPSKVLRLLCVGIAANVLLFCLLVLSHYPYAFDKAPSAEEVKQAQNYYNQIYAGPGGMPSAAEDERYVQIAERAAATYQIKEQLTAFIVQYGLEKSRALDVGAGRGYLQDVVDDYTGLDISATAKRYFHKPFVLGSATAMPFRDDEFDVVWSIWTLEHIPNPEQALREIRRVLKDNGLIYLRPAWNCSRYAAQGYSVRPYSDLDSRGRLIKASIPSRTFLWALSLPQVRLVRYLQWQWSGTPSTLRYWRLTPNYETYWEPDSDAVNSLDSQEAAIWFVSRGDECLNCDSLVFGIGRAQSELIVRVHKDRFARTLN